MNGLSEDNTNVIKIKFGNAGKDQVEIPNEISHPASVRYLPEDLSDDPLADLLGEFDDLEAEADEEDEQGFSNLLERVGILAALQQNSDDEPMEIDEEGLYRLMRSINVEHWRGLPRAIVHRWRAYNKVSKLATRAIVKAVIQI